MKYFKILFALAIAVSLQHVTAQSLNINGDTIYISRDFEVQLVFPAKPENFSTVPDNTPIRIWNVNNGINLIAGTESYEPAVLSVTEGGRNHRFFLVVKKDNGNDVKLYYDYSTIKKLEQHIRTTGFAVSIKPVKKTVNTEPVKQDTIKRKSEIQVAAPADSSLKYYQILEQGDKELETKNYQAATLSFNKAHSMRPADKIPMERLEEIKTRLAEKDIVSKQEKEKQYLDIMTEAKNFLNLEKFKEAQDAYKQALEIKPGDEDATTLLRTITNYLQKINTQNEKQKSNDLKKNNNILPVEKVVGKKQNTIEDDYNTAVKSGDNFFKAGNYDSAKAAYAKALDLIKRDWPASQIIKINKIQNEQIAQANAAKQKLLQQQKAIAEVTPKETGGKPIDSTMSGAEIKKNYSLAIAQGRSSYSKNDLANAKIFYEEALRLRPLQPEPENQLKIINNKLELLAKDAEMQDNYDRKIALADSLVNAKAFGSAIIPYKEASEIKPLESYPRKQLKYVQFTLTQIEKERIENEERRFTNLIITADKAVASKNYEEARSAYKNALSIHPDNDYVKRRLEIILFQLEKARLEKPTQDSIQVVPEIKSRKKRSNK